MFHCPRFTDLLLTYILHLHYVQTKKKEECNPVNNAFNIQLDIRYFLFVQGCEDMELFE